jgi:hypothetical protein
MEQFRDICLDAADPTVVGRFWAAALGQQLEVLEGGELRVQVPGLPTFWFDAVPEPKVVKNRVHLDLYVPDVAALVALGASVLAEHGDWSVLGDPEGNEFCAFPGETPAGAAARAFAICVDSADPVPLAAWWQARLGGEIGPGSDGRPRWLHGARGLEDLILKFVPVADRRVAKNRSHWDVATDDLAGLVAAGASVVREQDDEIEWTVLRDPQGNEFCAFTD